MSLTSNRRQRRHRRRRYCRQSQSVTPMSFFAERDITSSLNSFLLSSCHFLSTGIKVTSSWQTRKSDLPDPAQSRFGYFSFRIEQLFLNQISLTIDHFEKKAFMPFKCSPLMLRSAFDGVDTNWTLQLSSCLNYGPCT